MHQFFLLKLLELWEIQELEYTCLIRAVTSEDGMTADYFNFPKEFLDKISNKIVNNVKGINRVVYDISSKPPSTRARIKFVMNIKIKNILKKNKSKIVSLTAYSKNIENSDKYCDIILVGDSMANVLYGLNNTIKLI